MRQGTNVIRVKINDIAIPCMDGSVNFNPGGYNRETLGVDGRSDFYSESAANATLTGNAIHYSDTDLALLNGKDLTVTIEMDSGAVWTMQSALALNPANVSGGVAAFNLTSGPATEQ